MNIELSITELFSTLNVGEEFNIGKKSVKVISTKKNKVSKFKFANINSDVVINEKIKLSVDGTNINLTYMYGGYYSASTKKKNPGAQLFRDMEGEVLIDLINQNNPFHNNSKLYQLIIQKVSL
jgi:hypothetical protein